MAFKGDRFGLYTIDIRLGKGCFGELWKARGPEAETPFVALKIILDSTLSGLLYRYGARRVHFHHPNVAAILELEVLENPPYVVSELAEGTPLSDLLAARQRNRLEWEEATAILIQVLRALEDAHTEGIPHGNLKPQNILVDEDLRVRITDFSLGQAQEEAFKAILGGKHSLYAEYVKRVACYRSPEQMRGASATVADDIYVVGSIVYQSLTGNLPEGPFFKFLTEQDPRVPKILDQLLIRCFERRPRDRYPSAQEMLTELQKGLERAGFAVDESLPPSRWFVSRSS